MAEARVAVLGFLVYATFVLNIAGACTLKYNYYPYWEPNYSGIFTIASSVISLISVILFTAIYYAKLRKDKYSTGVRWCLHIISILSLLIIAFTFALLIWPIFFGLQSFLCVLAGIASAGTIAVSEYVAYAKRSPMITSHVTYS